MKVLLPFLISNIIIISAYAQTGPAGVGTSATNVLWLRADKGTSSTTNSTSISYWNDQSGNSINVTQTVAVQQPSFVTNVLNGFPGILFDNNTTAGQNDYMGAPDNSKLDNTPGYSFFTVTKMTNLGTDARCIVSKRTAIDVDEAFMLFYYTSNYLFVDIDGLGDRQSTSPTAYSTNTGYILDVLYDGTLTSAQRTKVYEGETLRATFSESSSTVPDKPSPLNLGCTHAGNNRPFGGYICEVVIYTVCVNPAQRAIVNNHLSSKYGIALSANDKYAGDNNSNGDYDWDVCGVGKESTGSNTTFSASACAGMGLSAISGFDNGDYILAGHKTTTNMQIGTDVGGMTGVSNARWQRIWYIDITNTSTTIGTNIEFDMSDGGVGSVALGTTADYVLLYRAGQTGNWTEVTTASAISGDKVQFNNVTLSNDGYYTIGTKNYVSSPLPIELLSFDAIKNGEKVDITWATASQKDNKLFTVERSKDGINFEPVINVPGAGTNNTYLSYFETDYQPLQGISYYRLKQTDSNNDFSYSQIVAVNYIITEDGISVYPNPSEGEATVDISSFNNTEVLVVIRDISGKECFSKLILKSEGNELIAIDSEQKLAPGTYIVTASANNKLYSQKLLVK